MQRHKAEGHMNQPAPRREWQPTDTLEWAAPPPDTLATSEEFDMIADPLLA